MCIAQRAKSSMPPYTIGIIDMTFFFTSNCCVRTSVSKLKRRKLFLFPHKGIFLLVTFHHSYFLCLKKATNTEIL